MSVLANPDSDVFHRLTPLLIEMLRAPYTSVNFAIKAHKDHLGNCYFLVDNQLVGDTKTNLGLKVRPALRQSLQGKADRENRSLANLAETLLEWSEPRLEAAGDSNTLLRLPKLSISRRVSLETQEHLFTALDIILRNALSAQIEAVASYLTRLAGKYGKT